MFRTALVCLLCLLGGYQASAWLTHDFQVWTDEGARRLEVALQPIAAPAVTVDGLGLADLSTDAPPPSWQLPAVLQAQEGVTIADFFYTRCQTICLSLGSSMAQLQTQLQTLAQQDPASQASAAAARQVRLLSISFDGQHDRPAILQPYAQAQGADLAWWRWLHLPDAAQEQALLRQWGIVVIPNELGDFEHNAALLVLDKEGRLRRIFDLGEQQLALNYALHLAQTQMQAEATPTSATLTQTAANPKEAEDSL
ncbi:MAG: SCO family protein [Comamonas sp.]|nr:SCO family protein [Comamonas sp.]